MRPGSTSAAATILVAYDCPATKPGEARRRALRKHLAPLERIQLSVYLGSYPQAQLGGLEQGLTAIIDQQRDRLLFINLGSGIWHQHGLGIPAVRLPPAALVIIANGPGRTSPSHRSSTHRATTSPAAANDKSPSNDAEPLGTWQMVGRAVDQYVNFNHWLWGSDHGAR